MINKIFKDQIDHNIEVYIDDMLVKSANKDDHIVDLKEAFDNIRHHRMKWNPSKCMFGVTADKFLGFMITEHNIEANLEKI